MLNNNEVKCLNLMVRILGRKNKMDRDKLNVVIEQGNYGELNLENNPHVKEVDKKDKDGLVYLPEVPEEDESLKDN